MKVQLSKIGVIGKSVIHMPSHGLREVHGACYASICTDIPTTHRCYALIP